MPPVGRPCCPLRCKTMRQQQRWRDTREKGQPRPQHLEEKARAAPRLALFPHPVPSSVPSQQLLFFRPTTPSSTSATLSTLRAQTALSSRLARASLPLATLRRVRRRRHVPSSSPGRPKPPMSAALRPWSSKDGPTPRRPGRAHGWRAATATPADSRTARLRFSVLSCPAPLPLDGCLCECPRDAGPEALRVVGPRLCALFPFSSHTVQPRPA